MACVCAWERSVKHNAPAWGILCVLFFVLCIYVFLYYVCMLLCVPVSACMHASFVHLVLVRRLECEETAEHCPTESAAFRKDARMSLSHKA